MALISAFAPLNYLGCISATLSSALSEFVSCPALLKVIAADKLYPYWMIGFTGKGYGKSKQPINAIVFTFLLSLAFVLIGTFQLKKDKKPSFVLQIQSLKYYEQFV